MSENSLNDTDYSDHAGQKEVEDEKFSQVFIVADQHIPTNMSGM